MQKRVTSLMDPSLNMESEEVIRKRDEEKKKKDMFRY